MVRKILFFVIIVTFLSGCSSKVSEIDHSRQYESFEGVITALPVPISGLDVTHSITTPEKSRVYLRSLLFDLAEYEDAQVRIFGDYIQEIVLDNPVDVLTVTSIDFLEDPISLNNAELEVFSSPYFGMSFVYDKSSFGVTKSSDRIVIRSFVDSSTITVYTYYKTPELDIDLVISRDAIVGNKVNRLIGNHSGMVISSSGKNTYVFIDRNELFYRINFENFEDSSLELIDSFLDGVEFIDYSITRELAERDSGLELLGDSELDLNVVEVNSSIDTFIHKGVVERFGSRVRVLLPNYRSPVSYSFTDNLHFYFVFINNFDQKERILFSYSDSEFTEVARFRPGQNTDWELVSGVNSVAERPLSVLIVEDGGSRSIDLIQGYRYFESLPLGFGIQYPQSWYYARIDDTYIFSDAPIESSNAKVKVELVRASFSTAPGNVVSTNIKRQNIASEIHYYVKVYDTYLKISGLTNYAEQLQIMANSVNEIDI